MCFDLIWGVYKRFGFCLVWVVLGLVFFRSLTLCLCDVLTLVVGFADSHSGFLGFVGCRGVMFWLLVLWMFW